MALMIKTTGLEDYLSEGEGFIKALIMGEPGVGKTRSAGFWPKPIFADTEKGRMSVADLHVPYVEITSSVDMFALTDELERECKRPASQRRFQTLVIDTVDALQRIVMDERLQSEKKETFSGWGDWGYLDARMMQFISRLHRLRMNIVVNCHLKGSSSGDDGPQILGPKLKGDFRDQIAAEFDLVGYMTTQWKANKGERVLTRGIRWKADPAFPMLKDRSGRLPEFTPVNFTAEDYTNLLVHMGEAMDSLRPSETVGEIALPASASPAPPNLKGGPVEPKEDAPAPKPAAKKAAAPKKAAKPAEPQPPDNVTVLKGVEVEEVGAVSVPADEPTQTAPEPASTPVEDSAEHTAALSLVQDNLGAAVVTEPDEVDPTPTPAPAAAPPRTERTCGTPGRNKDGTINASPAQGCGKSLAEEDKNLVNVAFIKTRTYLCADCFKQQRAAS